MPSDRRLSVVSLITMPPANSSFSNSPALRVADLGKSYGRRPILDSVEFHIGRGERVALMGPSGSGKSTLLNLIAGIDRVDCGEIVIDDQAVHQMDGDALCRLRREKVATVFQFFHLLPTLSVAENIEFPLLLLDIDESTRHERVAGLVAEVQLENRVDAFPDQLSGGEMQRAAIARALAPRPILILADEPTGNLDSVTGDAILDLLEKVSDRHGIAMLLVTHSEEATRICGRTLDLHDGRMADRITTPAQ